MLARRWSVSSARSIQTSRHAGWRFYVDGGNNGGDGFVIARYLHTRGVSVRVFIMGEPGGLHGDAGAHLDMLQRIGVEPEAVQSSESARAVGAQLADYDILIDALLGTGLKVEVSGVFQQIIAAMNASGKTIVAVDIPSGLSADVGTLLGDYVRADLTITMALPKRGLLLYPAAEHVGRLVVVDIGFPTMGEHASARCHVIEAETVRGSVAKARPDSHKGTYGHVLTVAGSPGKTGAGALAAWPPCAPALDWSACAAVCAQRCHGDQAHLR